MSLKDQAYSLIFGSVVREDIGPDKFRTRPMNVNVIVMSEETAREFMRDDYHGGVFHRSVVKTEPDRCFGVRVAYDRSLQPGEMMVGEFYK